LSGIFDRPSQWLNEMVFSHFLMSAPSKTIGFHKATYSGYPFIFAYFCNVSGCLRFAVREVSRKAFFGLMLAF